MGTRLLKSYLEANTVIETNRWKLGKISDWISLAMLNHPEASGMREVEISWQQSDCPSGVAIMVEIMRYGTNTRIIYGLPLKVLEAEYEQDLQFELPEHRFRRTPSETFSLEQLPGVVYYLPGKMQNLPRNRDEIYPARGFEFIILDDPKIQTSPHALLKIKIPRTALTELLGDNESELMRVLGREDVAKVTWNVTADKNAELLLVIDIEESRRRGLFRFEMIPSW